KQASSTKRTKIPLATASRSRLKRDQTTDQYPRARGPVRPAAPAARLASSSAPRLTAESRLLSPRPASRRDGGEGPALRKDGDGSPEAAEVLRPLREVPVRDLLRVRVVHDLEVRARWEREASRDRGL